MTGRAVLVLALLCGLAVATPSVPGASDLVAEDPLERSVREISLQLRCPVCQGENLYDSQSSLASEMRAIIREQLAEGRSESEIIAFFVDRYGDYVRLAPRLGGGQLVVWLLPLAALALGTVGVTVAIRRRQQATTSDRRP